MVNSDHFLLIIDITQIKIRGNEYPLDFINLNKHEILEEMNRYLSTNFNSLLIYPLTKDSSVSIFLEHNLYADEFALSAVSSNGNWKLTLPHENGINIYDCTQDIFFIKGKSRFCRNFLISTEGDGSVVVVTNVLLGYNNK